MCPEAGELTHLLSPTGDPGNLNVDVLAGALYKVSFAQDGGVLHLDPSSVLSW
jgi:hypothetical protein